MLSKWEVTEKNQIYKSPNCIFVLFWVLGTCHITEVVLESKAIEVVWGHKDYLIIYCLHFTDEETKAQKGKHAHLQSHI